MQGWKRPVGIDVPYVKEVNKTQKTMKRNICKLDRLTPGKLNALSWYVAEKSASTMLFVFISTVPNGL